MRFVWLTCGLGLTGIGLVGTVLPVLPTTIFLILAAGCFARSSPRLEAWLIDHPVLGPPIIGWRETGAIPRPAKRAAYLGLIIGLISLIVTRMLHPVGLIGIAFLFSLIGWWIASRPEPEDGAAVEPPTRP
ncbi:MAG: YbaN family protein [Pseudomonadota bacterium]